MRRQPSAQMVVSYFCGMMGFVVAEWIEDKIRVLEAKNQKTIVLTSVNSNVQNTVLTRYYKIPSLSWRDFKSERKQIRESGRKLSRSLTAYIPISFVLGSIFDFGLRVFIKETTAARWSWAFSSFPCSIYLVAKYGVKDVFCTGGATGGHLLGVFITKFARTCLFLEFQDPLLGAEMIRSNINARAIIKLENLFIKTSCKTVFVTKKAADSAKLRHSLIQEKIVCIYPGSWRFLEPLKSNDRSEMPDEIEFIHLGTLYGTRNLNNLFEAINELRQENSKFVDRIQITNLGDIYSESLSNYQTRSDFTLLPPVPRIDALRRAQKASFLLLVQHTDGRSAETIPYKTYDYFNIGAPVFAIINNSELKNLILERGGYVANSGEVSSIKVEIKIMITDLTKMKLRNTEIAVEFDIKKQFEEIFKHEHWSK